MSEWDAYAEGWDEDPMVRAYASAAFTSLEDLLARWDVRLAGMSALDFGCGTGLLTERLVAAGADVVAVDSSPAMVEVVDAKIERHGWAAVSTAASLPSDGSTFDLVVCSSVCAFVEDYPGVAGDLVASLTDGGGFVQWDWERVDGDDSGLSRDEIRAALTAAGLVDVDVRVGFEATVDGHTMAPLMGSGRRPATP